MRVGKPKLLLAAARRARTPPVHFIKDGAENRESLRIPMTRILVWGNPADHDLVRDVRRWLLHG